MDGDGDVEMTSHAVNQDAQDAQLALRKIFTLNCGATFLKARQVYFAVVRPAMKDGL